MAAVAGSLQSPRPRPEQALVGGPQATGVPGELVGGGEVGRPKGLPLPLPVCVGFQSRVPADKCREAQMGSGNVSRRTAGWHRAARDGAGGGNERKGGCFRESAAARGLVGQPGGRGAGAGSLGTGCWQAPGPHTAGRSREEGAAPRAAGQALPASRGAGQGASAKVEWLDADRAGGDSECPTVEGQTGPGV